MHFLNKVGRAISSVGGFYKDINPSTLSGAVDVIVVETPSGGLVSSPFHVRFGKFQLFRPQDRRVELVVNGNKIDVKMKVGMGGEAFFVPDPDIEDSGSELAEAKGAGSETTGSEVMLSEAMSGLKVDERRSGPRIMRPTSGQLKKFGLDREINDIVFKAGKAMCHAKIYCWKADTKIVVSDVDGTITKSDALGYFFNMVGKDWTHLGIAGLFTRIVENGYKIMYLTSRTVGHSNATRAYLRSVEQGSFQLPEGPLIMSPDRFFASLHREIILKRPEEFKMTCLGEIKGLFGDEKSPFYAGFGNRTTDAVSYRSVGIPPSRIFTINPTGQVRIDSGIRWKKSYICLTDLVDYLFPPIDYGHSEFNDLLFWKLESPRHDPSTSIDSV